MIQAAAARRSYRRVMSRIIAVILSALALAFSGSKVALAATNHPRSPQHARLHTPIHRSRCRTQAGASAEPGLPPARRQASAQTTVLLAAGGVSSGTLTTSGRRLSSCDEEGRARLTVVLRVRMRAQGRLYLRALGCHVSRASYCARSDLKLDMLMPLSAGYHAISWRPRLAVGASIDYFKVSVLDKAGALAFAIGDFRSYLSGD